MGILKDGLLGFFRGRLPMITSDLPDLVDSSQARSILLLPPPPPPAIAIDIDAEVEADADA